jgi:hypothetical protein
MGIECPPRRPTTALVKRLGLAAFSVALLLGVPPSSVSAQGSPAGSSNAPRPQIRGVPTRGVPTRGISRRGVNERASPTPPGSTLVDEPEEDVLSPSPRPPTSPKAPAGRPRPQAAGNSPGAPRVQIRPRLLTLRTGQILRARSRWIDGRWSYATAEGWRKLPVDAVLSSALQSDVLDESRRRRRLSDPNDPVARRSQAQWLLDRGLVTEGLRELDELLALDGDDPDVLELLSCMDRSVLLPTAALAPGEDIAWNRLLAVGARQSPSLQELTILQLVEHGIRHRNALERSLQDQLSASDPLRRTFGALALRRLFAVRPIGASQAEQHRQLPKQSAEQP